MNTFCQDCPSKAICSCLCPEAELYVSQDEKPQRELTLKSPRFGKIEWPESYDLTDTEKQILTLSARGFNRRDIAEMLNISRQSVRQHISNAKKKYLEP